MVQKEDNETNEDFYETVAKQSQYDIRNLDVRFDDDSTWYAQYGLPQQREEEKNACKKKHTKALATFAEARDRLNGVSDLIQTKKRANKKDKELSDLKKKKKTEETRVDPIRNTTLLNTTN